ncbi:f-box domain containing protein [Colletotrichum scovillei]|uniref:F-box domain containing protein n=1 Tax=Colletotrichum scovillei TaxID=1209932 RepID=A0A9P7QU47_9PEZI|nr:f-box domain containing protein [Colletotrichum scovillei]KAG7063000.1 f-box domain containing protein [Colletotrichum scovillei]
MELSSLPHSPTEDDGNTASSQAGAFSDDVKFFTPRNNCLSNVNTSDQAAMSLQGQSSRDNKRKAAHSIVEVTDTSQDLGTSKRPKFEAMRTKPPQLPGDRSLLPSGIWHRVFAFLPPRSLGTLLRVNKLFNGYLDSHSAFGNTALYPENASLFKPMKPDTVWQHSRRLHHPRMPSPLENRTELDMWRLCCTKICQYCGVTKPIDQQQESSDPWRPGPGVCGLATVFAFGVTCCGPCLLKHSVKEIDLLLSSTIPSSLIPALASVFVTPELQAIPSSTLETNVGDNKLETTKLYSTSSITAAKEQLNVVQSLGTAAVEEWLKGLGAQGKELRIDASRWEKWAAAGGLAQMCRSVQTMGNGSNDGLPQDQDHEPRTSSQTSLEDRDSEGRRRSDKTHEEAAARKALRRAEIERRAMLLDPPLPPNVVVHMPSFQAAIQITAALDENAWNTLKPRLLSQRADAERNVNRGLTESRSSSIETKVETTREVTDQDWDDIQGPVRARMSKYADEIIRGSWNKGRKVNKENSPRFAVGVLLSVRSRFYADVAKDTADAIAAGRQPVVDPQGGPFTQKLTLENMKWVFDMKIKQHTEPYRKELFLCNGCESHRFYGFEGVIQHYAAKHTKALSLGNIVVHWRAEWPEQPIFKPNGRSTKGSQQAAGKGTAQGHAATGPRPPQGHDTPSRSGSLLPSHVHRFPSDQVPPLSYHAPQAAPYNALPTYSTDARIPRAPYLPPNFGLSGAPQFHPVASSSFGPIPPGPQEQPRNMLEAPYSAQPHSTFPHQGNFQPPSATPQGMPFASSYTTQLENLARIARDIWNSLSTTRDLPGPLRVYITIHHVVKRFWQKFGETPSLRMFNDGLSNNKAMRPVRNINGLRCRSCTLGLGPPVNPERTMFSLPQLVNHFENQHAGLQQVGLRSEPGLDWTQDMILMPDVSEIPDLKAIIGGKGHKFNLVNEAVPWVFNRPNGPTQQSVAAWPLGGVVQPSDSGRTTDDIWHTYATHADASSHERNPWHGPGAIREPPIGGQEQQRRDTQPSTEDYNRRSAALPYKPLVPPHEAREPGRTLRASHIDPCRQSSWGASPTEFDREGRTIYFDSGHPAGGNKTDHYMPSGYSPNRTSALPDENCHGYREPSRAPDRALVESRYGHGSRYPVEEEERVIRTLDQSRLVRSRPLLDREQLLPQDTRPGSARCAPVIPHSSRAAELDSTRSSAGDPDDFSLTAALESHLAQDRDALARVPKAGLLEREIVRQERRSTARDGPPSDFPNYPKRRRMEVEVFDDARHGHSTQYIAESHGSRHTGHASEVSTYYHSPAVTQNSGRSSDNRSATRCASATRPQSADYEETYEIVHVRDAEGEYIVRRPILRERETHRVLYEDDTHHHQNRGSYSHRGHDTLYDSMDRTPIPGERRDDFQMREACTAGAQYTIAPSSNAEYDPDNLASMSDPCAKRPSEY